MMNQDKIAIYNAPDGEISIDVRVENETIWLTQKQIAELFGTEVPAISKHIKNIFENGELMKETTVSKMEIVQLIGNNALVAITLMIAESRTEEKDTMVKVVTNLINQNNYYRIFAPITPFSHFSTKN